MSPADGMAGASRWWWWSETIETWWAPHAERRAERIQLRVEATEAAAAKGG